MARKHIPGHFFIKQEGGGEAGKHGTLEPWNPGTLEPWNPEILEPLTNYCRRYLENIIIISDYVLLIDVSLKSKQGHD